MRPKRAIAVSKELAYARSSVVCRNQVQLAVTIEISDRHPRGSKTGCVIHPRFECAVAVSQQNAHTVPLGGAGVRCHKVKLAVPIQVSDCYRGWLYSCRVINMGLKRAIPVPQQN